MALIGDRRTPAALSTMSGLRPRAEPDGQVLTITVTRRHTPTIGTQVTVSRGWKLIGAQRMQLAYDE